MTDCIACSKGNGGKHHPDCTVGARFWRKVAFRPSGCWEWIGSRNNKGYGELRISRGKVYAHRFVYEECFGPIAAGFVVMHTCDNPACVRGAHLRLGTQADNMADMKAKGRQPTRISKSHCRSGHELSPENTYTNRGARVCRECNNASRRKGVRKPYTQGRVACRVA